MRTFPPILVEKRERFRYCGRYIAGSPASCMRRHGAGRSNGRTMWKVYFLKPKARSWYYVGSTDNLPRRVGEHNKGKVRSTRAYLPVELVYTRNCKDEKEARALEQKIKKQRLLKEEIIRTIQR